MEDVTIKKADTDDSYNINRKADTTKWIRNRKKSQHKNQNKVMKNSKNTRHQRRQAKLEKKNKNLGNKGKMQRNENSCTISADCVMNVITYAQTSKEKIKNYERQKKRIQGQVKRIENKVGKKDNFQGILQYLQNTTGMNGTGCQTSSGSFLVETYELTSSLNSCSETIASKCVVEVDLSNDIGNINSKFSKHTNNKVKIS